MKQRVLIDQNLKSYGAHNATTAIALLESDPEGVVIANQNCALEDRRIDKRIGLSFNSPESKFPGEGNRIRRAAGVLMAVIRNNRHLVKALSPVAARGEQMLWIWRDGDPRNCYAAMWTALRGENLNIILYFHNHPSRYLMRPFATVVRFLKVTNLVCVHEDPQLAEKFSAITGLKCGVLPFPLPLRGVEEKTQKSGPLVVTILGSPRLEKGIDLVADLLPLMEPELKADEVRFVIQAQVTGDPSIEPTLAKLTDLANRLPNIILLIKPLDESEYSNKLKEADILLLPYRLEAYGLRNSGVVMEGVATGKVLILTAGTLIAEHAKSGAAHHLSADGDVDSLQRSLRAVIDNIESLRGDATKFAKEYVMDHDPMILFQKMESLFPRGESRKS